MPARRRRWGIRIASTLSALVLTASGVGHSVVAQVADGVSRVDAFGGLRDRPDAGSGLNILLIGTDSRDGLSEEERARYHVGGASCRCADAILLLHVSQDRERVSMVSLPRDSFTHLPEHTLPGTTERHEPHDDKLNSALSHGGPQLMVRAVEDLTRVRIDHYLEVSFVSFMRAVDQLGGVEVCTAEPLRDAYAGLDLPAGTSTLDGPGALAYVRARHLDGASDFGRMQRQQRFLAAFVDKAVSGGVLLNPGKVAAMADTLLDSVRADEGLGSEQLLELAGLMRHFTTSSAEFASVPVTDREREMPGLGSTVIWNEEEAARLFTALRDDRPLPRPEPGEDAAEQPHATPAGGEHGTTTADQIVC
ncbi:LCP family protein [Streptomyces triticirhizae]|uniref:LytR family transcriptional regulator n=1 Tax=Streptomyces triticirhizae TaxID=2483353 RepID=A0A3M2LR04_9ACTN|nr:LCP family protein [Streptomyces triticirhizae]RMI37288.1 LytR family transcriptional regulator [Streptomyces triticirhizae]